MAASDGASAAARAGRAVAGSRAKRTVYAADATAASGEASGIDVSTAKGSYLGSMEFKASWIAMCIKAMVTVSLGLVAMASATAFHSVTTLAPRAPLYRGAGVSVAAGAGVAALLHPARVSARRPPPRTTVIIRRLLIMYPFARYTFARRSAAPAANSSVPVRNASSAAGTVWSPVRGRADGLVLGTRTSVTVRDRSSLAGHKSTSSVRAGELPTLVFWPVVFGGTT
jgi:hypothetical protein